MPTGRGGECPLPCPPCREADGQQVSDPTGLLASQITSISAPKSLTSNYPPTPRRAETYAGVSHTQVTRSTAPAVWEADGARTGAAGLLSPVALFKLCLQIADPISCPWVFLLQQIQAIDHWWARWVGKDRTNELGLRSPGALPGAALVQHTVGQEADGAHRAPSPSSDLPAMSWAVSQVLSLSSAVFVQPS